MIQSNFNVSLFKLEFRLLMNKLIITSFLVLIAFNVNAIDDFTELTRLAKDSDARAQTNLGVIYYDGEGLRQNYTLAKNWFGKSCDNGLQQGCDAYHDLSTR